MADLTLSIASLREHHACNLDSRIADLRRVMPEVPDDQPVPLRVWWDLPTTSIPDRFWSLRAAEPELSARILGVRAACLAARRVLHRTRDQDRAVCEAAVAAAERWADNPSEATRTAAYAACAAYAADAAAYAADAAAYAAAERDHQRADLDRLLAEVTRG